MAIRILNRCYYGLHTSAEVDLDGLVFRIWSKCMYALFDELLRKESDEVNVGGTINFEVVTVFGCDDCPYEVSPN